MKFIGIVFCFLVFVNSSFSQQRTVVGNWDCLNAPMDFISVKKAREITDFQGVIYSLLEDGTFLIDYECYFDKGAYSFTKNQLTLSSENYKIVQFKKDLLILKLQNNNYIYLRKKKE